MTDFSKLVGRSFHDTSHPEEPDFTVEKWDPEEPGVIDLDNSQWYELDGPEGFWAKLASGVITERGDDMNDDFRRAAIRAFRRDIETASDDEIATLISEIRAALEGDSNDDEHDALARVAEVFGIDWDVDAAS